MAKKNEKLEAIQSRLEKLRNATNAVDGNDPAAIEKAIALCRALDAESAHRRQMLREAEFDAKWHPDKEKPFFAELL